MKKLMLLLMVVVLASCGASVIAEEELPQVEVIEPEVLIPEVVEDVIEEPVVEVPVEEPIAEEEEELVPQEEIVLYSRLDQLDATTGWQRLFDTNTSYLDFRFVGCMSVTTNQEVECRKYDYNIAKTFYFENNIYFTDGDVIRLTQPGNPGFERDDDLLQVVFIGELLGVLPAIFRDMIDEVHVEQRTTIAMSNGVLKMPLRYDYEYNTQTIRELFMLFYQDSIRQRISLSELKELISFEVSQQYSNGTSQQQLLEAVLWYYFYPVMGNDHPEHEMVYDRLETYFSELSLPGGLWLTEERVQAFELPPHDTLYVNSERENVRIPSDPSALDEIIYRGKEIRNIVDRRLPHPKHGRVDQEYYVFDIIFVDDDSMEFLANTEIDFDVVEEIVFEVSLLHGQLPRILRENFDFIGLQPGFANVGILRHGYSFHLDYYNLGRDGGRSMNHFLIHEMGHISLDWEQALRFDENARSDAYITQSYNPLDGELWKRAIELDDTFSTLYAEAYPLTLPHPEWGYSGSEDVADTLVFYIASRMSTERFHPKLLDIWETALGNRFAVLDQLDFTPPAKGRLSQ